mmetsp:Transcript_61823/g.157165  ORF Transcript_61823/g.157165 Transcript_61823/m.157165 type:complete len:356 (-) Transcript_61823:273-1340(-)
MQVEVQPQAALALVRRTAGSLRRRDGRVLFGGGAAIDPVQVLAEGVGAVVAARDAVGVQDGHDVEDVALQKGLGSRGLRAEEAQEALQNEAGGRLARVDPRAHEDRPPPRKRPRPGASRGQAGQRRRAPAGAAGARSDGQQLDSAAVQGVREMLPFDVSASRDELGPQCGDELLDSSQGIRVRQREVQLFSKLEPSSRGVLEDKGEGAVGIQLHPAVTVDEAPVGAAAAAATADTTTEGTDHGPQAIGQEGPIRSPQFAETAQPQHPETKRLSGRNLARHTEVEPLAVYALKGRPCGIRANEHVEDQEVRVVGPGRAATRRRARGGWLIEGAFFGSLARSFDFRSNLRLDRRQHV